MLDITSTPSISSQSRAIHGRYLALNKLPPCARAWLAAEILEQRIVLTGLTAQQVTLLCRVSVSSLQAIRNGNGQQQPKPASRMLEKAWHRASPEQRVAFIQSIGTEPLWTALTAAL